MEIKRIRIRNFRSIKDVEIDLNSTTVFIGPNNAGKSAILEAIRIALTRRWGQRGTGFTEYDVHLCEGRPDPKVGDPVVIDIELQEENAGDWPEDLQAELADIVQLNVATGLSSILLRVSCAWDAGEESYVPRWEFLNVERSPLVGRGARAINTQEFFQFLPVFYLEALRDAADEFNARGQFWGKLLRTVQIPDTLEQRSKRLFDLLNKKLLASDPMLGDIASGISDISQIAAADLPGEAEVRVLPLNTWDILSKTEIIYRTEGGRPWLPLVRHGQGVQSLSVMFVLKLFVELLLTDLYKPDSTPVLALEEPETHLHPQAARALWSHIQALPGQKIVTTHSPYFLQHVPFRDLRVVRVTGEGTRVWSLPRDFRAAIAHTPAIDALIARHAGLLSYDRSVSHLVVKGILDQAVYRELLVSYAGHPDMSAIHAELRKVYDASVEYIPDDELQALETYARRIRGEIFFARRWLLVEGQSEYHIVHGMAKGLGYDLDEHGVAVIDFQNNGNSSCFPALARALGYPWLMVADGDAAGADFLASVAGRGFGDAEMRQRAARLPNGTLEEQLVHDGLQAELKEILTGLGTPAGGFNDAELLKALKDDKSGYAAVLGNRCATDPGLTARMPQAFQDAIRSLRGLQ